MAAEALNIVLGIVDLVPALGSAAAQIAEAIWGGDTKAVEGLTKALPTSVQMQARALAVKAEERRKAADLFGVPSDEVPHAGDDGHEGDDDGGA